jgi:hypothetical protein
MKPSPYPNYCKKLLLIRQLLFFNRKRNFVYYFAAFQKLTKCIFLDKFLAYRAIFTVIENHSFFNAKFNFKYPLFKGTKKNQQIALMKRIFKLCVANLFAFAD